MASPYAKSLTPPGYRRLFQDVETHLMPEERVTRDYFFDGVLDLARKWSDKELASSEQGLSVLASKDPLVFKRTEGLWDQRIRSIRHPCVNPAYSITGRPGNWELRRRVEERFAKTISGAGKTCIPETSRVSARATDAAGLVELQRTDPGQFTQLAKSLVVLDLPERFIPQSQVPQRGNDWVTSAEESV